MIVHYKILVVGHWSWCVIQLKMPQLTLGKKISVEFPINLFGVGMGIMLPDSEISLLSLKRLQCLKDVNIFPWFKGRQNLLRLVVSYNICKIQCMFHLFTSLMFSYCTSAIQLTSTFITQFKYKINRIKDEWHENDKSCIQDRKKLRSVCSGQVNFALEQVKMECWWSTGHVKLASLILWVWITISAWKIIILSHKLFQN